MATPDDATDKAASAYNAAADFYDNPANSFWERFGYRTIERLRPPLGARILDVCCGSGASAIPAAEKVGPEGFVLGIDVAENLLDLARMKAADRGQQNIQFRAGDLLELCLPPSEFDAVVCVFGIFFVPDMSAAVRGLWQAFLAAVSPSQRGDRICSSRQHGILECSAYGETGIVQRVQPVGPHL